MKNEWLTDPQDVQIQGLLDRYMRSKIPNEDLTSQTEHSNDDLLAAFIEGNLSERETKPIVSHLIKCSFCRHITAELIRLDDSFAGENAPVSVNADQPSKISEVLANLLSKIFGTSDEAVFAHEEKEESEKQSEQNPNKSEE